jgi:hypothetical protein
MKRGAAGARGLGEDGRGDPAQPAALAPDARKEDAHAPGNVGREIDHGIVPGDSAPHVLRREEIEIDGLGPRPLELAALLGIATDRRHLVARRDQHRYGAAADDAGRTRDEDPQGSPQST